MKYPKRKYITRIKTIDISYQDDRYLKDVLLSEEYGYLFKNLVVIDVGANIGTFSFYIYNKSKKIYAIEPAKENLSHFRETVALNNLDKIEIFELAICGLEQKDWDLKDYGPASGGAWKLEKNGTIPTRNKTLAEFIEYEKIDYVDIVKIDTEGSEMDILDSADFPKVSDRINTIIGELHLNCYDSNQLVAILNRNHYKVSMAEGHFIAKKI